MGGQAVPLCDNLIRYGPSIPIVVQEGEPITVDVEEFQNTFACKPGGCEWSERQTEQHREG